MRLCHFIIIWCIDSRISLASHIETLRLFSIEWPWVTLNHHRLFQSSLWNFPWHEQEIATGDYLRHNHAVTSQPGECDLIFSQTENSVWELMPCTKTFPPPSGHKHHSDLRQLSRPVFGSFLIRDMRWWSLTFSGCDVSVHFPDGNFQNCRSEPPTNKLPKKFRFEQFMTTFSYYRRYWLFSEERSDGQNCQYSEMDNLWVSAILLAII
jgi:hypothetical protein